MIHYHNKGRRNGQFKSSKKVTMIEVGPRDGFQFESKIIPTQLKVEIINDLVDAGITHIQTTSFVNSKKVPQMADGVIMLYDEKEGRLDRIPKNVKIDESYSGSSKYQRIV